MLTYVESVGPSVRSPAIREQLAEHYDRVRREVADTVKQSFDDDAIAMAPTPRSSPRFSLRSPTVSCCLLDGADVVEVQQEAFGCDRSICSQVVPRAGIGVAWPELDQ